MDKILIIDDSILVLNVLKKIFEGENIEIVTESDPYKGIEILKKEKFSILLLDITMPNVSGFDIFKAVKQIKGLENFPVIFITSSSDDETIKKCFNIGAVDYVKKPFNDVEIKSRVIMHIKNTKTKLELNKALIELNKVAHFDPLTNLYNRRYFIKKVNTFLSKNYEKNSLILCDIDNFKIINDTYGHEGGDLVLKVVSDCFLNNNLKNNCISRWGGEEFIIYIWNEDFEKVNEFCEKLRLDIQNKDFIIKDKNFKVTASFGLYNFKSFNSMSDIVNYADKALYQSKRDGKNRITVYNQEQNL